MLELYKQAIAHQYDASFQTLRECLDGCDESTWNARVCNFGISHVVYHTLFFADLYLCSSEEEFRTQGFHAQNQAFFNDYDELSYDSSESKHSRDAISKYLNFCRARAAEVVAAETQVSLEGDAHAARLEISRAEMHVYIIRHMQHHAAQISLRLRLDSNINIRWVKTG